MESMTSKKTLCATCNKTSGLFTCRGCGKDFCLRHTNEHRQELGKQIDELTCDHNNLREKLTEQTIASPYYDHFKQKIDQWEEESINKIQQQANTVRIELENLFKQYSLHLNNVLTKLADEIKHARQEDEFFEIDIKQWTEKLNQLKYDLNRSPVLHIQQDKDLIPFISKISINSLNNEFFDTTSRNIILEDNDQVILHGFNDSYATIRGRREYIYGQHRIRFRIEEYHSSKWIFIGIISKDSLIREKSMDTRSAYGWAAPDQVYINGIYNRGYNYESDIQKNDILELFIDCDERKICLKNERTNSSHELNIDLDKCPFPWQLNINMYFAGDRIRLLSI